MAGGERMVGMLSSFSATLRKMEAKLQCVVCSKLLQEPKSLPCNHILCRHCIMTDKIAQCPQCNSKFPLKDIKGVPHVEDMLKIFHEMEASIRDIDQHSSSQVNASTGEMDFTSSMPIPPGFEKRFKRTNGEGPSNLNRPQFGEKSKNEINKRQKANLPPVPINLFEDECAFCHSWRRNKATGEMYFYKKGKKIPVEEGDNKSATKYTLAYNQISQQEAEELSPSEVIYVHKNCVYWSPRIYTSKDGEMVNLAKEITRAAKLKCNKCGHFGAALGCFYEHCERTYHVPCASEILECRWDMVNYNILCPAHVNEKLLCDETNSDVEEENENSDNKECSNESPAQQTVQKEIVHAETSVQNKRKFMLFCSALSNSQKEMVQKFATKNEAIVVDKWKKDATHFVDLESSMSECRRIRRIHEVMMAILQGSWIVTFEWISACLEKDEPVSEEPYEVNHDFYGDFDGPRKGRMRAAQKAPNLFTRLGFSLSKYLPAHKKRLIEELVTAGGGNITNKDDNFSLLDSSSKRRVLTNYLVYNENPQGSFKRNKEFLEFGANDVSSRLVSYERVLDAVAVFDAKILNKAWYDK